MKRIAFATLLTLCMTGTALAWSNHALASYRAFEAMPEVTKAAAVPAEPLVHDVVSALPARDKDGGGHHFVRLLPGESVAPLAVLASASDEPDYGMDLNLWEDNPSSRPLSMVGMPGAKDNMIILLSNRHFVLERYESQMIQSAALACKASSVEAARHDTSTDASYPAWSDLYARNTVARQAHDLGVTVTHQMLATVPTGYVNDPGFDFGLHAKDIDLMAEVARQGDAPKTALESTIATLMRNASAHSRNLVRGILQESGRK